jgi:PKHD-type hydroxylase
MNFHLPTVLDTESLRALRALLTSAQYADGASTAGWHARPVKRNEQALHDAAAQRVMQALGKHPLFNAAALPMRLRAPIFSRYRPGMSYGLHVDDALMGGANPVRTDLALTLFLSDPADYDGGELVIESGGLAQGWKLPAGDAILYPANTLHRVAEVTRGERHAAILWVQSHVRDPAHREILFDLDQVRRSLWEQAGHKRTPDFERLAKTYSNLLRQWAEV